MPLVVKSGTAIDEALKLRGLRPKDIDKVLLVGGTSKIPLVRRYVTEKLAGKEPESFDEGRSDDLRGPGGGHRLGHPAGAPGLDNYAYSVKLEHSLCANPINEQPTRSISTRSSSAAPTSPARSPRPITPWPTRPSACVISVYEGDVYDNPDSPENVKLAEIPWEFKPPRPQRDGALEVTFEYGDDGILTVQIHDTLRRPEEALRHPADRRGPDGRLAAHQDEAHQRGAGQPHRWTWKPRRSTATPLEVLKKTEQDVIPQDRERGRPPRAGGPVPAGAPGDGLGRPQEDGRGRRDAQRSAAELRVFACERAVTSPVPRARTYSLARAADCDRTPCSPARCARRACAGWSKECPTCRATCRCWSIT